MLAYLRLIVNPTDEEALRRIINYPTRGIGKTTLDRLYAWAGERNEPIWNLLTAMADQPAAPQGMNKVVDFVFMIRGFQTLSTREDAYQVAQHVSKHTGLHRLLVEDKSVEGISRMQNIEELLNAIREYTEEDEVDPTTGDVESRDRSLAGFLQHVALLTDADLESDDENAEKVSLMTIHQAKGLEFSHVYVAGLEETLFPSSMSLESRADLEEERRLFYVAITRAEKRLTLTYALTRFRHGNFLWPEPSRFLSELDPSCLDMRKSSSNQAASTFGVNSSNMRNSSASGSGYSSGNTRPSTYGSSNGKSANTYGKAVHKPMPSRTAPANQESVNLVHFEPDDTTNLKEGMKVLHQRFGKGDVLSVEGVAPDHKATIRFIQQGEKIILLKFARMKIIG
jgi:DNA helicase-2/ATP-dependent DNA helicase PcrA